MCIRESKYSNTILLESSDYSAKDNSYAYICCNPIAKFYVKKNTLFTEYPDGSKFQKEVAKDIRIFSELENLYFEPRAWALSSITNKSCFLAKIKISSMFVDWPNKWTGTMALVFEVIKGSMWSTHILKVFSSTSAITGFSPNKATTSAVATYVKDGQMTSSPGFKLQDIKAICNASVPLAHGITFFTPRYDSKFFWKDLISFVVNLYGLVSSCFKSIVEKPSFEDAPSDIAVCGRYILTSSIFNHLQDTSFDKNGEIQLTDAIRSLIKDEEVLACIYDGEKFDCGSKKGFVHATIALALRDESISVFI